MSSAIKPYTLILLGLTMMGVLYAGPTSKVAPRNAELVPEGLAKSDWQSIRAAYEAGRHAFMPVEGQPGVMRARNPGQQWTTTFDGRGFIAKPREGEWTWGLELQSYRFEGEQRKISGAPTVKADGQRLSYQWDATVCEWWVNDQRGLEHGFTVMERPREGGKAERREQGRTGELSFLLATRGSLKPSITADGLGVLYLDGAGATVLNYTGLKVWDADGKELTSHFEAAGESAVMLMVDVHGARYPITIDPIAQQAYLKAGNNGPPANDEFGHVVAVDGDTVVVGAPEEDSGTTGVNSTPNESAISSGAAYVFVRSGGAWSQQAYLKANQVDAFDRFGYSVAVSGDTVVIGADGEDSGTTGVNSTANESAISSGAAYVFVRSGGEWSQQAYLKANQVDAFDGFGYSVAVSGDTVVVGAANEGSSTTGINSVANEGADNAGAAYVFVRSGEAWSQQAYLKAHAVSEYDYFGMSVALSGDTMVVGAPGESSSATGVNGTPNENAVSSGAAYVFVRSDEVWSQQAYLKASNSGAGDNFGFSVALSGETVVVGAMNEDSSTTGVNSLANEGTANAGAVYVFTRSGTEWTQQAYLKASNTGEDDRFGCSVGVSGDTVVVGACYEDSSATGVNSTPDEGAVNSGAAYVFRRNGAGWSEQAYFKASQVNENDLFGWSVAVSGGTVLVGALYEDSSSIGVNSIPNQEAPAAGSAYVFEFRDGLWSQHAYVKPSIQLFDPQGSGAGDCFGISVAVSGDTVVVGAPYEDSSSTGVNSVHDENARAAGAAYVFVRSGSEWRQQAYLKASNAGMGDYFGYSVAVSGDTVVIGARNESSSTTGVNSTPDDNALNAGAAYVFTRRGEEWSQQAYLKASNAGAGDSFGRSVAVSQDTVVVGAWSEDSNTTGVNSSSDDSASDAGAAYVFTRTGSEWSQQAYLKAHNTGQGDHFGISVSVSGGTVVVGADLEDSKTMGVNSSPDDSASNAGAAYVFTRLGSVWSQQAYLKADNTGAGDFFGGSVSVSGDTVVIGAFEEDGRFNDQTSSGAAYVFFRSGVEWSQQAYLKASNAESSDRFGLSVAVDGDIVVVGAPFEDSSTTGVYSVPDNDAGGSGAAYVFVRVGVDWSQWAYLKAQQVSYDDRFGYSVAVYGDTAVVGAYNENSSTTGVNSVANEISAQSGASYIFTGLALREPEVVVERPQGVGLVSGETELDFGSVFLKNRTSGVSYTIRNLGSQALDISKVRMTGGDMADFAISTDGMLKSVPAGGSTTFQVAFAPVAQGLRTAQLSILTNDFLSSPFVIRLRGTGLQLATAESIKPTLVLSTPVGGTVNSALPLLLNGMVGDANGVNRVDIVLNDELPLVATLGPGSQTTSVPFSATIRPVDGLNTVVVTAYDLSGNSTSITRRFTFIHRELLTLGRLVPFAVAGTPDLAGKVALTAIPSSAATSLVPRVANSNPRTSNVRPGKQVKLTATPGKGFVFSHWIGLPSGATNQGNVAIFAMPSASLVVTASFVSNPFNSVDRASNSFYGLIRPVGEAVPSNDTEGFITGTLIPASGVFTGKLLIGGVTQSFKASLYGNGNGFFSVSGGKVFRLLFGERSLTLRYSGGEIIASVVRGTDVSVGTAMRGVHSSLNKVPVSGPVSRGTYTMVFPAKVQMPAQPVGSYAQGDGYSTLKLSDTGKVTASGVLADGTAFTGSSEIVGGGASALFAQLITPGAAGTLRGGSFGGMLVFDTTLADSDVEGENLHWFRPAVLQRNGTSTAVKATQIYTSGWPQGIMVDAVGALYDKNVKVQTTLGLPVLDPVDGNGRLDIMGGKLSSSVVVTAFNLSGSTVIRIPAVNSAFTLRVTQSTGAFSGSFTPNWLNPVTAKPTFKGILLQGGANSGGYGFFISNASGDLDPESGVVRLGKP